MKPLITHKWFVKIKREVKKQDKERGLEWDRCLAIWNRDTGNIISIGSNTWQGEKTVQCKADRFLLSWDDFCDSEPELV